MREKFKFCKRVRKFFRKNEVSRKEMQLTPLFYLCKKFDILWQDTTSDDKCRQHLQQYLTTNLVRGYLALASIILWSSHRTMFNPIRETTCSHASCDSWISISRRSVYCRLKNLYNPEYSRVAGMARPFLPIHKLRVKCNVYVYNTIMFCGKNESWGKRIRGRCPL